MLGWLFASAADRRLLGGAPLSGPTPWVIAIMSFSIVLIAATGVALSGTAAVLTRAIEARYALEVPAGGGDLAAISAALSATPGVGSIEPVPERDMRATLERWLGPAAQSGDLPVPALVNFDLRPGVDVKVVEQRLHAIAPAATITAHRASVAPVLHSLAMLQWVAFGLVLLLSAAAAAAVVLAARGALDTHRFTIEVMHGIGATDRQVTHLFQRKIAIDALVGALAGGVAAALVLLLIAGGASFAGELTGGAAIGAGGIAILALLPIALTVLATMVGRMAVLAALRRAL